MVLYILANPNAGNRSGLQTVNKLLQSFPQAKIFQTQAKGDEQIQVRHILQLFDRENDQLAIIGGDGTLSLALSYLPKEMPFAYFPAGSGNDFAKSLELQFDSTLLALKEKQLQEIWVLEHENGVVLNSLDAGFAAEVIAYSEKTSLKRFLNTIHLGRATYLLSALCILFQKKLISLAIEQDGQEKQLAELFFLSVANSPYFGGGLMIWPTASPYCQGHELVVITYQSFFKKIQALLEIVFRRHQYSTYLKHQHGKEIQLHFPREQLIQIDGEIQYATRVTLRPQKRFIYQ